jgi:AbrB family looped-hinge helix DNA binding protein
MFPTISRIACAFGLAHAGLHIRYGALECCLTVSYHESMETTKLSSKGQVVLPKAVRDAHGWAPGTEFTIEVTTDGVRLRPRVPFASTDIDQVFGSVPHTGPAKSLQEMDEAIGAAVARRSRRARKR